MVVSIEAVVDVGQLMHGDVRVVAGGGGFGAVRGEGEIPCGISGEDFQFIDARLVAVVLDGGERGEADIVRFHGGEAFGVEGRIDRGPEIGKGRRRAFFLQHKDIRGDAGAGLSAAQNDAAGFLQRLHPGIAQSAPEGNLRGLAAGDVGEVILVGLADFRLVLASIKIAIAIEEVNGITRVHAAAMHAPREPDTEATLDSWIPSKGVLTRHVVPPGVAATAEIGNAIGAAGIVAIAACGACGIFARAILFFQRGGACSIFLVDEDHASSAGDGLHGIETFSNYCDGGFDPRDLLLS